MSNYCNVCGREADPGERLYQCDECLEMVCPHCFGQNEVCLLCDEELFGEARDVSVYVDRLTGDIEVVSW